ncbi:MAG: alpha/beta hydrolase [Phycisphaerales bacterium]|nr:MAG: alpha/beta hydrolase [Phycisphaerales bacterium]
MSLQSRFSLSLIALLASTHVLASASAQPEPTTSDSPHPSIVADGSKSQPNSDESTRPYREIDASLPALAPVWPDRLPSPIGSDSPRGVIVDLDLKGGTWSLGRIPAGRDVRPPEDPVLAAAKSISGTQRLSWEGPNSLIATFTEPGPLQRNKLKPAMGFVFISATEHRIVDDEGHVAVPHVPSASASRTWFVLHTPEHPRAVVLLMPGMLGTPEGMLELMAKRLMARDIAVLRMIAQPSRFTQHAEFIVPDRESIPSLAGHIAEVFGDRTAECAYAAQAAFEHVFKAHPELASVPRVAIGYSAGAMTLPTVLALEPDKYAAGVIVGGGCHYWLISELSNYATMIDAIVTNWGATPPTADLRSDLAEAYLAHAPLDSFHTATILKGTPMLMYQAKADLAVPTELGDVLWDRLGKPERWLRDGGHESLFFQHLPKDLDAIVTWIESNAKLKELPAEPKESSHP